MIDAVDFFLNNAVDLYVQAVDYCRISTSQIPTPVGAGIRQIKPESGDVRQMLPDSGDILSDSGQNGRTPDIWPNLRPGRPVSGQLAGIRPFCAEICICQILKNILILFFINIFYFVNKI